MTARDRRLVYAAVIGTLLVVVVVQAFIIAALAATRDAAGAREASAPESASGTDRVPEGSAAGLATTAAPDVVPPRPTPTAASRGEQRQPIERTSKNPTAQEVGNVEAHGQVLEVTAYCWTGSRTASGVWPARGMAAGNDWPFGTRLRVQDVGVVTVTDRYGYGTQLDIYLGHYDGCEHDALVFGRRHLHVEVAR